MNKKAFLQHFTNNWIQFGFDKNCSIMKGSSHHYTHVTKDGDLKIWVESAASYKSNVWLPLVGEQIENDLMLNGWSLIASRVSFT